MLIRLKRSVVYHGSVHYAGTVVDWDEDMLKFGEAVKTEKPEEAKAAPAKRTTRLKK